ncbi:MAG TPA: DUF4450 domain-containing protein, partial [Bacteroides sp.]|nr:DUF4450 domain-containing protein [Bacteroides sp.]
MKKSEILLLLFISLLLYGCDRSGSAHTDPVASREDPERALRYHPDGGDFVIVNGERRFNRALYGTHTGFRVETGDLPEFAMYLRGMGGNFKMGLASGDRSLWITDAGQITARYRPGTMLYEIRDPMLGKGTLNLQVLALADEEGMVIRAAGTDIDPGVQLVWAYGGANGKHFSREGDIGANPESVFYLKPEYCEGNRFETEGNSFSLVFTSVRSGEKERIFGLVPPGGTLKICDAGAQDSPGTLLQSGSG